MSFGPFLNCLKVNSKRENAAESYFKKDLRMLTVSNSERIRAQIGSGGFGVKYLP